MGDRKTGLAHDFAGVVGCRARGIKEPPIPVDTPERGREPADETMAPRPGSPTSPASWWIKPRTAFSPAGDRRWDGVASWFDAAFGLDERSLAAFRIAAGGVLILDAALRCRDFTVMFTPDGMFPLEALRAATPDAACWSLAFLVDAWWWTAAVLGLQAVAGAALAAGFHTRLATVLAWVAVVSVIRRTVPVTNAGDVWLSALLLWGFFLPLGRCWSIDAARAGHRESPGRHRSAASVAMVLQVLVVYFAAGVAKCNVGWVDGSAVQRALSVHYHGTTLGAAVAQHDWLAAAATWIVLGGELALPLVFLLRPGPRVRLIFVATFLAFHLLIATLMSVGLFSAIGCTALLTLLPGQFWDAIDRRRASAEGPVRVSRLSRPATAVVTLAGCLAASHAAHEVIDPPWPYPAAAATAVNLMMLPQDWGMFGTVPPRQTCVRAAATLADGSLVDLLRGGQPIDPDRPDGGYGTLPNHRWHKLCWELPGPRLKSLAPSVAAGLAWDWNHRHPSRRVVAVDLRFGWWPDADSTDVLDETVLASWPARDESGHGNLDRWLGAQPAEEVGVATP